MRKLIHTIAMASTLLALSAAHTQAATISWRFPLEKEAMENEVRGKLGIDNNPAAPLLGYIYMFSKPVPTHSLPTCVAETHRHVKVVLAW